MNSKIINTRKSIVLLLALLMLVPVHMQATSKKSKVTQPKSELLPLDPTVKVGKLPNGFTYYIRKNSEPKSRVTLYLANKVGSILENDDQQGLAHFIEHMSFNGTTHFPKNELVSYLQKAGVRFGGDLNAYTGFDETVYQLPLPTDNAELLQNGFQIMRDWAHEATLDPDEIEKERGVILEEKRLGKNAQQRLQQKYLPVIFNQSRYSNRLPIGNEEVLKNFKPQTIKDFYNDWYRPDLQALIVVGDIDVAATEQTIIKLFSDLKAPVNKRPRTKYTIPLAGKNQFFAATDKEFPITLFQVFIKHEKAPLKSVADYRNLIVRSLYNQIIGGRIGELSKQANPPFIQGRNSIGGFMGNLDMVSTVVVGKPGELENGFKAVWTELERIKRFGITLTELNRAKETLMQSIESTYKEKDKTNSNQYVNEYLNLFLKGEAVPGIEYEYRFYQKTLPAITVSEVNKLIKQNIVDVNRDILLLAPEKEAATLPSEATVNGWLADVQKSNITAYKDQVSDKPLMATKPIAGKIIAEKKDEAIGVTELTLSNGVKVILKPTDFKNDEITFTAFSPGGTSLYSDDDYESASTAADFVNYGGIADFSATQLEKYLSGKQLNVSPYINERFEGVEGYSTPKDFETALQLTNLYFTNPRKDVEVFKGVLSQQKAMLATRSNDPASIFNDTISAVLGNYSIRRTGPSVEKLNKINLDRAFEIYKERFADADDFTFTFVGNLDVEKIKPLLELYLGSLPTTHRTESARNLGIEIPAGKIQKEVFKGQEPKASVKLVFSGKYQYGNDENDKIDALTQALSIKLTERLRENESGVYGVGARASYEKYPVSRYTISISFGCAPENVDKLINSTLDEMKKMRESGPLQVDIDKSTAEKLRVTEVQLKKNGFWISYLAGQYQNNENPEQILTYKEDLNKITSDVLKAAANNYLTKDNYIRFVLYPDKK